MKLLNENDNIFNLYKIGTLQQTDEQLLLSGGAGGHMWHPFDVPSVKTLDDIVSTFYDAVEKLDHGTATVKLDGVNLSLKVVGDEHDPNNPKQFALDRGSQKEIDVRGITIDNLQTRFQPDPVTGKAHGMIRKGKMILEIMNAALPSIKDELMDLGLYTDPTKFINTEYIDGKENVVDYGSAKLIAFHGVNQFYQKRNRQGEETRPGLKPSTYKDPVSGKMVIDKTVSRKIQFDPEVLESLREKVKPFAEEFGFDVITGIYVTKRGVVNFEHVLGQPFTVVYSRNETVEQPLDQWFNRMVKIPKTDKIQTLDGKILGAVSKNNYMTVLNGQQPLDEVYKEEDIQTAVNGALTYHITRVLGNEVLNNYTTDKYGDTSSHEGIVITDQDYGKDAHGNPNSIKITGDFIVDGMGGAFASPARQKLAASEEDDQSAPMVNYGGGKMDFSSYFNNPRSMKDPGGSGYNRR